MYFIYVIHSEKTKDLYYGFTTDLKARLQAHNNGDNESTKFGVPWEIVYCEGFKSEKDAQTREKKLKHYGNSRTHVKNRIKDSLS